ncbi:MAG TPA: hypothetical protein VKI44_42285, partial [Acetobacteraceae bacterium]|nr:hypothetical protein [Acetobacteraceae bacterium]
MVFSPCYPWESDPAPVETRPLPDAPVAPKRRGRRPAATHAVSALPPVWRYHHLTVSGPAAPLADFSRAARGAGVIPWRLDFAAVEEDIFNLAVTQRAATRNLSIAGCRILARQFRARAEAHHSLAVGR